LFASKIMQKTTQLIYTKFGGKVAQGPQKKPLGFGGNQII